MWSPAWLKISGMYKISEKLTADVSATPEVGVDNIDTQKLEPLDVSELSESIKALTEELEANTPAALKKEISRLQSELAASQKNAGNMTNNMTAEVAEPQQVPVPVLDTKKLDELHATLNKFRREMQAKAEAVTETVRKAIEDLTTFDDRPVDLLLGELRNAKPEWPTTFAKPVNMAVPSRTVTRPVPNALHEIAKQQNFERTYNYSKDADGQTVETIDRGVLSADTVKLSGLQQRIVDGLAEISQFGVSDPGRKQLGFFIGSDLTGGAGSTAVKVLNELGIVECPPGRVSLTVVGKAHTKPSLSAPKTRGELHARVRGHLDGLQTRVLDPLLAVFPEQMHRKELGPKIGSDLTGGAGSTAVKRLIIAGIVEAPKPGFLRAASTLFPAGLK